VAAGPPYLPVGEISYRLVRRLYDWFGHTDDAIPYTTSDADEIDIEQIKNLS